MSKIEGLILVVGDNVDPCKEFLASKLTEISWLGYLIGKDSENL